MPLAPPPLSTRWLGGGGDNTTSTWPSILRERLSLRGPAASTNVVFTSWLRGACDDWSESGCICAARLDDTFIHRLSIQNVVLSREKAWERSTRNDLVKQSNRCAVTQEGCLP